MRSLSERAEMQRIKSWLGIARKILVAAMLVEIVPILVNPGHTSQTTFNYVLISSAILGIVGFSIVYKQLDLADDALANSPTRELMGPNLKGGLVLMFCLTFFVPIMNLIIIIWAYLKARSAMRLVDQYEADRAALNQRKVKLYRS